ncbi:MULTISPECIES: DUF6550 family protein [Caproicibacterium]|jgi:hypothetical protein|uniref:Uncharacterized protein n=1 Tax=Caproicibacterium lactatifermentans TaxID=2666138 RepID=A0ABX6PYE4_9FIRM|nr:DUF6550 family protein [Caproicibacterium lactatifermentans]ARP50225.1 hypothetical protein B6259_04635 [Ruminococcaceae bacterium CPB6]QKO30876.1 hypothetical protein GKP14_07650 [Caproicibacterium lactatifermentans]
MKKLSDKAKRSLTIAGIGVVCVAVIIGISYQLKAEGAKDVDVTPSSSASSSEVTVSPIGTDNNTTESTAPSSSASSQAPETSSKADQVIQPDVSKPAAPSSKPAAQGSTTNPSKAPTYSSKDTSPGKGSGDKNFQKKDGKIYVPGFGWVTNNGGGGSGSTASDMYENGNKVGQMD